MPERRFYWLRLREDFFSSKRIKKLRKLAGGDTLTIIYLKMQLKSIKTDGVLTYTGLEKSFAEELALDLDESIENVALLLNYLSATGLMETSDDIRFLMPYAEANIGSEGASAQRMRDLRARQDFPALPASSQCDEDVTTKCEHCYGEKEIEKDIEREKEKEKEKRFSPPLLEELQQYISDNGLDVDAEQFMDYYRQNGWRVGKNKMKDWKATARNWHRRNKQWSADKAKKDAEEAKWFDEE